MISSIKTPGVYINEIDAFPPSIAQVKTAVPAFIGYTEKGPTDQAVKIRSLLDYDQIFGKGPAPTQINSDFTVDESQFKLYNSLRLFFTNGGGEVYIVSIGGYTPNPTFSDAEKTKFINGLAILENEDEPTLLLCPDAVGFTSTRIKDIQTAALAQCADLKDRFAILDVKEVDTDPLKTKLDESAAAFRDGIGTLNLKYGAAYYPYLRAQFPNQFRFSDVHATFNFKVLNPTLIPSITSFESLHTDLQSLTTAWKNADKDKPSAATLPIDDGAKVNSYVTKCWGMLDVLQSPAALTNAVLTTFSTDLITTSLRAYAQKLFDFETKYESLEATYSIVMDNALDDAYDDFWKDSNTAGNADFVVTPGPSGNAYDNLLTSNPSPGADDVESYPLIQAQLDKLHNQILSVMGNALNALEDFELNEENNLTAQIPDYTDMISKLNENMNHIPPSGAIAGIYAQTDATRGVWKAPGNLSVSGIVGLADDINDKTQEDMNIHETGKSINAIRKFTGKGNLVWGVRTLAGNSNDWRHINVRRLANMIEESTKKACMNFVFEPNVKQTWVNVKGMIENYLTTLWSDGALAGAKPADAFFVSVGLGETMSALDLTEGRMIVKIGYAPSRPAEFIILEFKQQQQKS